MRLHRAAEVQLNVKEVFSGRMSLTAYERLIITHATVTGWVVKAVSSVQSGIPASSLKQLISINDALSQDLNTLSLERVAEESLPVIPATNTAQAFGLAYVILGATHGSRILYPRLRSVSGITHLEEYHYFKACTEFPAAYWSTFTDQLNKNTSMPQQQKYSLQSATEVFRNFIAVHEKLAQQL